MGQTIRRTGGRRRPLDRGGAELAARLRERLPELEAAIATRVYAISDPHEVADPTYLQGLNAALAAAIDHRLTVLEVGERRAPAVPAGADRAGPARCARRRSPRHRPASLLRRQRRSSATSSSKRPSGPRSRARTLRRLLAAQATLGDRLLAAVSAEHAREAGNRPAQRRGAASRVRQETARR